jgi:hypothetical protein
MTLAVRDNGSMVYGGGSWEESAPLQDDELSAGERKTIF